MTLGRLRGMTYRHVLAALILTAACDSHGSSGAKAGSAGEPAASGSGSAGAAAAVSAPAADPLRDDFERICNSYTLSGAAQDPTANGTYLLATWLDANITSEAGRDFLVEFAQLGQDKPARVAKLEATRVRLGLAECPLIARWQ